MNSPWILLLSLLSLSLLFDSSNCNSIVFSTVGRSRYIFDIFAVPVTLTTTAAAAADHNELQLTDGVSVNYNGFFTPDSSLLHVSDRDGASHLYLHLLLSPSASDRRRSALQFDRNSNHWVESPPKMASFDRIPPKDRIFEDPTNSRSPPLSMVDRPSISRGRLIYVSTEDPSPSPRRSWAAIFSTDLPTGPTRRLTPPNAADFSPSVSPSGDWTAVASSGDRGWSGEIEDLNTSIYIFRTEDGSNRSLLVDHGGWPCWAGDDDSTLFFHRRNSDGWWSIHRATIGNLAESPLKVTSLDRITPPGFHAFTPAAFPGAPGVIAAATRRPTSQFRHIELIDLRDGGGKKSYVELTRPVNPHSHHYNPFISPDGTQVGYHRCRGRRDGDGDPPLLLENIESTDPESFSLLRIDGSFPSFSPSSDRIAFVRLPGLYVLNSDGSGEPKKILSGNAFATAWDWKRKGVVYTSYGPHFSSESTRVDIISVAVPDEDEDEDARPSIKKLTIGGENNAFPSPSPDGRWVVFRSGRSGHKNLYIMDSVEGERAGIHRLTEGPWSDTMCNWSPDGDWIAFSSDRESPGSGSFAIYMLHPNGTGLRKVVQSGDGGRANHPWFSPDSKSLVFTSDYAAVSAEPIGNPHHYQPYGDIFTVRIDGSDIRRLTHNPFEDGTPTWAPSLLKPADVPESLHGNELCNFDDCHWLAVKTEIEDG